MEQYKRLNLKNNNNLTITSCQNNKTKNIVFVIATSCIRSFDLIIMYFSFNFYAQHVI